MEELGFAGKIRGGKSNKTFMLLSAFGILFVIDAHVWTGISFLSQIFPYDSFFMPMFIFISGYFFKPSSSENFVAAFRFIGKKFKGLMLPYFFWIAFYGVLTLLLRKLGIISFGSSTLKSLLVSIFSSGTSFGFNSPSWFIPSLFCVCAVYCIIKRLLSRVWNDAVFTAVFILLGMAAVYFSRKGFNNLYYMLLPLKTAFFLQFYQLGISFRKYFEALFDKMNTFAVCGGLAVINLGLFSIYGNNIAFPNCATMSGFRTDNLLLPLITSATGILFWLKLSKELSRIWGNSRIINYISDNTFFIMTHHLLFKCLFSGLLIFGKKLGISCLSAVSVADFKTTPWYVFSAFPWVKAAYFIFTLVSVLAACFVYNHIKKFLLQKIKCGGRADDKQ